MQTQYIALLWHLKRANISQINYVKN